MQLTKLFEPGRIGNVTLKNRVMLSPMLKNYSNRDGTMTQKYIDYLVARAKGGVGLLLIEATYVDRTSKGNAFQLGAHGDHTIPGLRRLADAVHQYGTKVGLEIQHRGRVASTLTSGFQPVAPSAVPLPRSEARRYKAPGDMPHALTKEEIKELVQKFADAARRGKEAGMDVVEIHGAHGYLINQFISARVNKRTDEYGGSLDNRLRFAVEIIRGVRNAVGPDYPILFRVSCDDFEEGGTTFDDVLKIAPKLEAAGIDLLDVSGGAGESIGLTCQSMEFPLGLFVPMAQEIKALLRIPTAVVGRINDPVQAETILAQGQADFISIGRALHADPDFVNKAQEGKFDDIRRCIACMQGCVDIKGTLVPITCTVNPAAGKERELEIKPAERKKKVLVVGGGPGGMEAAMVAAQRGHSVTLVEKENELGGQVRFAAKPPRREEFGDITRNTAFQLKQLAVDVRLGQEATVESVEKFGADVVIVATGAYPFIPPIPGVNDKRVATYMDVVNGNITVGKQAMVIGSDWIACMMADWLSEKGTKVVVVDPAEGLAGDMGARSTEFLQNKIKEDANIEVRLGYTVEEITPNAVRVQKQGNHELLTGIDLIVLSTGATPENRLAEALAARDNLKELHVIGDCNLPGKSLDAIRDAYILARHI